MSTTIRPEAAPIRDEQALGEAVRRIVRQTPILDLHTHLYAPAFGKILLWGVDELLTYHYLTAEFFRYNRQFKPAEFFALPKERQAELIWNELFLEHSPLSESNRGVLTSLRQLGLEVGGRDLNQLRSYFRDTTTERHVDRVLEVANVSAVVMTNDPFDEAERPTWLEGRGAADSRFLPALRIDPLLNDWDNSAGKLERWGYRTSRELDERTLGEIRRFLEDWLGRMNPLYLAVSLPPTFRFPEQSQRARIIEQCILPVCRRHQLPFAMMIGVKKLVNPALQLAGDAVGRGDIDSVEALARDYPDNKFLVTFLSRENQHESCIAARKFGNLMLFGCWWFMNNPSIIDEITLERLELLGTSFIPQHSDARVLDQLLYKWAHSRELIGEALIAKYADLLRTGWRLDAAEIERDVRNLFSDNFKRFVGLS